MTILLFLLGAVLAAMIGCAVYWKARSLPLAIITCLVAFCLTWLVVPQDRLPAVPDEMTEQLVDRQQMEDSWPDATRKSDNPVDDVPDESSSGENRVATGGSAKKPIDAARDPRRADANGFTLASLQALRPIEQATHGYVGSDVCRECHTREHSTWTDSYHRTMTQVASPESILGNFEDVTVTHRGRRYKLTRESDVFFAEMPDEHDATKRIKAPIVMTTGSHHMQVYWFATGKKRLIGMLPLVYLNESQEWIPRESAFLVPPNMAPSFEMGRWNEACSSCHSTHRKARRLSSGEWDTHVGEFGISCEACHGPAEDHVQMRRLAAKSPGESNASTVEDPIVNPAGLSKVISSQVCGQCHSVSDELKIDANTMENGHGYRPGLDLTDSHGVWSRDSPEFNKTKEALGYDDLDTLLDETFYRDGMVRVSGREFNGMVESECYINGEMTCLSCHKMHQDSLDSRPVKEWANDQMAVDALGDSACTQCHQAAQYGSRHTHHAVGSTGSSCYNCHMPHTAFGLLKAIRNHQVSSPNIEQDHQADRPNACNQCHLDKTLKWSADHLQEWYQIEPPELETNEQEVAASLLWLLKGNAAERAIAAWCMGWDEAKAASGDDWQLPFLAAALDDDYDAVRLIARRSIQSYSGMEDFSLDVVTSTTSQQRQEAAFNVLRDWTREIVFDKNRLQLLIEQENGVQVDRIRKLIDQRDNSRVLLSE